jgi:hypothetical protein
MKTMKFIYKNKRWIIIPCLILLAIGSCKNDNFLTVAPKGKLTNEVTFSSTVNADLFVNDIYNQLPNEKNDYNQTDSYTDNDWTKATHVGANTARNGSISAARVPTGPGGMWDWEGNYSKIRKCNVFFQQTKLYASNFTPAWLASRTAEVTFLRAYYYSQLFTNYGGVPIITDPLDATSGSNIFIARSTIPQTLAFIEADCDAAAAGLPATIDKSGRATQGAALALKGWVELFAASPLCNTINDIKPWAKAAATNLQIMNMGVYSLYKTGAISINGVNYAPGYAEQFLAAANFNNETIFARGYAPPNNGSNAEGKLGPVIVKGVTQCWGNYQPTQSLVDDFSMANGLPITDPASGYDPKNPYLNREPRFYATVVYDGAPWQGDIITTRIGGNNQINLSATLGDVSTTGYYGRKLLDESIIGQTSLATSPGSANWIIFRYGEVLLNYAEAQNEAAGPDASVYAALLLIRSRAGLPNFPAGLSQSAMRADIRRERRIELSFEEMRWYDIRRWLIATGPTGVLNTPDYGMKIVYNAGVPTYTPVLNFTNIFKDYNNWMPIPQGDLGKNPNLVQNPGY